MSTGGVSIRCWRRDRPMSLASEAPHRPELSSEFHRAGIRKAEFLSMPKPAARLGRIAILWRGDEVARRSAAPGTSRFKAVFASLAHVGVDAEPVVYEDDVLEAVRGQLATFDGASALNRRRGALLHGDRCAGFGYQKVKALV